MNTFNEIIGDMPSAQKEKELAAKASIEYVDEGMLVGLGTGSTAEYMLRYLGERVKNGLEILGVPSSDRTAKLAKELGIPLTTLGKVSRLDVYIDGADEIDRDFQMIKGGGGALLREKILAHNSNFNVIIIDSSKKVDKLEAFKLPIEVIPLASGKILGVLKQLGLNPSLRKIGTEVYKTDENNVILDVGISKKDKLHQLNSKLLGIPGIVETGLFLDYVDILIEGKDDIAKTYKTGRRRSRM